MVKSIHSSSGNATEEIEVKYYDGVYYPEVPVFLELIETNTYKQKFINSNQSKEDLFDDLLFLHDDGNYFYYSSDRSVLCYSSFYSLIKSDGEANCILLRETGDSYAFVDGSLHNVTNIINEDIFDSIATAVNNFYENSIDLSPLSDPVVYSFSPNSNNEGVIKDFDGNEVRIRFCSKNKIVKINRWNLIDKRSMVFPEENSDFELIEETTDQNKLTAKISKAKIKYSSGSGIYYFRSVVFPYVITGICDNVFSESSQMDLGQIYLPFYLQSFKSGWLSGCSFKYNHIVINIRFLELISHEQNRMQEFGQKSSLFGYDDVRLGYMEPDGLWI